MQESKHNHVSFVSRLLLGFLFIYHGLVPKLLWLHPVEVTLVNASGLGLPATIVSPLAGIGEIALGCLIIAVRSSTVPVYMAALALALLLALVGVTSPEQLIGAFNPVTTNILGLGFCYLILFSETKESA